MADQELVQDLRAHLDRGDVDGAFRRLYEAHARDVARFVRVMRPAGSDDVCQETWAAVLKALPAYRFQATPRVWLFAIARRKAIDDRRRRRRDAAGLDWDGREEMLERLPWGPCPPTSPSSAMVRHERAAVLEHVLAAWPPRDREMIELRFAAGVKPREIVAVLGLGHNSNAVSQRLVRLARRLREELLRHDVFASRRPDV